jgi:ATP-binding cassette subfamily B protein
MSPRSKKFLSYYKPHLGLLVADLVCAFVVSAITLVLPLCARYITKNVLEANAPDALGQIYTVGAAMLALVVVHVLCNTFVDYRGHMMGTMMELYHHGPEDIVIGLLKFVGAFSILITINVELTLIVFLFFPIMTVYAMYFNKQMNIALRASKDRIGDINAQVEDTLAGIRVVQSFTNETKEKNKFCDAGETAT